MDKYRIGYGNDIHRFAPYRPLFLCGCRIPCRLGGLLGHSDADAPVHAVIDALLGALCLGDIGHFFPETDPEFENASGEMLMTRTLAMPEFQGWELANLDMTIMAEEPKLAPHIQTMRESLANLLKTDVSRVSIKAKTGEGIGIVGRCEAIDTRVVLLLHRKDDAAN